MYHVLNVHDTVAHRLAVLQYHDSHVLHDYSREAGSHFSWWYGQMTGMDSTRYVVDDSSTLLRRGPRLTMIPIGNARYGEEMKSATLLMDFVQPSVDTSAQVTMMLSHRIYYT